MDKIINYELFTVPPRWLFLRVETEEGLVGWGEPIVEGRAKTTATAVAELMDKYVMKMNPNKIEDIWQVLYRSGFYRGGPIHMSALAGIDQAMWDLKGKRFNSPIYELMGGACRDRVRVYKWVGGDEPGESAEAARKLVADGFTSLKMNVAGRLQYIESPKTIETITKRFVEVREAVGSNIDIAIDFHGRVSESLAPRIAEAIAPYMPFFLEEPVPPGNWKALTYLKGRTSIPIALGERLYSRWDFRPYLEAGVVDVIQPDLSHAGGITECKKIASYGETYDTTVAFHCPLGPIALAASLQVAATTHNFLIQETSLGLHYNEGVELTDYLKNPQIFKIKNGYINLPKGPGLGIEIDEEVVKEASLKGHDWKNPVWRYDDGSIAEW
jgi:galactonate dehydratase (EC 4.2.1.6)